MKRSKLVIFKVHGKVIEEIEANEITLDQVEIMKTQIAIMHGVGYDDVEVDVPDIEVPDCSATTAINENGKLVFRPDNPYASFREINGLSPALDISKHDLFDEFLELLGKNKLDEAIVFRVNF